jgi:poly(3-hydroxybutyrate) depolymerase
VMDMTAEYYLRTVEEVFISHALPSGRMRYRDHPVDPGAVRRVALMTVEGENDDITGLGQTQAAHGLCRNLPAAMKLHRMQPKVGHYGIFNGSRYRAEIVPEIVAFTKRHDLRGSGRLQRALQQMRGARGIEIGPEPAERPVPATSPRPFAA